MSKHEMLPSRDVKRQTKEGYTTVDHASEAREILKLLEHNKIMLKSVVQGSGLMAGHCDEVRSYPRHDGELQVQPPLVGSCHWVDIDVLASSIYWKQLPVKVVEWEDRI